MCLKGCAKREWEPIRSWLTLAAVFGNNFLVVMPQAGFGLWYDPLVTKYDTTRANVGMSYSIFMCMNVALVFASPLVTKYGVRNVSLVGAFLCTTGSISCAFSQNIWVFNFLFGVVAGLGRVLLYMLGVVEIQHLFHLNRGLATGLACFGYNVADMIAPLVFAALQERYDVTGSLFIHGAIQSHSIAFCLLYEDTRTSLKTHKSTHVNTIKETPEENVEFLANNDNLEHTNQKKQGSRKVGEAVRKWFDFSVFSSYISVVLLFLRIMWRMAKYVVITHLASAAIHYGFSEHQAAYVMTLYGIVSFIAMLYTTPLLNMKCVRTEVYFAGGMSIMVVATACAMLGSMFSPFCFYGTTLAMGLSESMGYASYLLVVVKLVGTVEFHKMLLFIESMAVLPSQLMASWFGGWLVDVTGDYLPIFLLSMLVAVACFILTVVVAVYVSHKQPHDPESLDSKHVDIEPHISDNRGVRKLNGEPVTELPDTIVVDNSELCPTESPKCTLNMTSDPRTSNLS